MDPTRLKNVSLFADLSRKELELLGRWADEVEVDAGKHLVHQGDFAHEFFVIEDGRAEVVVDERRVAELGPGDFFGEMALIETDRRTASVTAMSPMRVIVMFEREFRAMDREMPEIAERIREAIRERRPTPEGG